MCPTILAQENKWAFISGKVVSMIVFLIYNYIEIRAFHGAIEFED